MPDNKEATITYSLRVPKHIKDEIKLLAGPMKKKLDEELLITIAAIINEARFNPVDILGPGWVRRGEDKITKTLIEGSDE